MNKLKRLPNLQSIVRALATFYFRTFFRLKVYGRAPESKKLLLAANHSSFFDPPILTASYPDEVHFLARDNLFKIPVLGKLITKLHAHPIQRGKSDLNALKTACQLIKNEKTVVLFPEGTRSSNGQISNIKGGVAFIASHTECDIIPVYIHGSYDAWNRHRKLPKLKGNITCVIGSPITWSSVAHLDKKMAQTEIAKRLEQALHDLHSWLLSGAQGTPP
ncbi:MAG: plsC [Chlamydiales bacterium]|jgi:1-acyl-sn-glycerol-3-phosphate acyltransferase|nr:plsC [Chlamydiales bacterium]